MSHTKKQLAIQLSKLAVFQKPEIRLEQYATDSETAAEAVWFAHMQGDIECRSVADLGCGTGILGIAALLLGADKVYFVDNDEEALGVCGENLKAAGVARRAVTVCENVAEFNGKVDTVIQNPPFGTKTKHADKKFLQAAFKAASVTYSFHKISTRNFVAKFAAENRLVVTNVFPVRMQLKRTYAFHKSRIKRVEAALFRMERKP